MKAVGEGLEKFRELGVDETVCLLESHPSVQRSFPWRCEEFTKEVVGKVDALKDQAKLAVNEVLKHFGILTFQFPRSFVLNELSKFEAIKNHLSHCSL
jgi:hypothetical protein